MFKSASWAPTIGLSWLWGLGFFFSFHITLNNGLVGFLAFAVPNALGFCAFGWVLGAPGRDPGAIFRKIETHYTGLFLACQVIAVAITLFAVGEYVLIPLFGIDALPVTVSFVLLSVAVGHAATIDGLKRLHIGYLAIGLAAAVVLLVGLVTSVPRHAILVAQLDGRFLGLILPSVIGFALGPWTDVQHWQRVAAIRAEGGSPRAAYAWGAALFLGMISLNAAIALAAGPGLAFVSADGVPGFQRAVAGAVLAAHSPLMQAALTVWAGIAVASTLDSFYAATRWLLRTTVATSDSPLFIMIPKAIVTSPLWFLTTAIVIAVAMADLNISMLYLMVPFATLLAGPATCLVCESLGAKPHYDATLCALIGSAAFVIFACGYIAGQPGLMAIAPVIGLIGALDSLKALFAPDRLAPNHLSPNHLASNHLASEHLASNRFAPNHLASDQLASDLATPSGPTVAAMLAPGATGAVPIADTLNAHGFDAGWFVLHLTPTYDDTNSVGNVYFANYFRWVGKCRELFFNACMPDFDLRSTDFFVLTKSFKHDFRHEIREFQAVTVRIRIGSYNRKFVTLAHEIHSRTEGIVGRGEQTIMFVDKTNYRPLDIPPVILQRFLPHVHGGSGSTPKTHAPKTPAPTTPSPTPLPGPARGGLVGALPAT